MISEASEAPNVTTFPSFDFIRKLPDWISFRIGKVSDNLAAVFWSEQHQLHVDCLLESLPAAAQAAVDSLSAAIFEKEHPRQYLGMIRRQTAAIVAGVELSDDDVLLWRRFNELKVDLGLDG